MSVVIVTGSGGLVGSEAARGYAAQGFDVVGIDNDMRSLFFGPEASTAWNRDRLIAELGGAYRHVDADIRDRREIDRIFTAHGRDVALVVHAAAQPSHDWAARDPQTDFSVNANGTLNLLEATRRFAPEAVFIFVSTNKVYGDAPNRLPLRELEKRWEIEPDHSYAEGVAEDMPIDRSLHSLFGASKLAADVLVQEYGRYFDIATACFRGGCLTGSAHSGAELHGFLAYLMQCCASGRPYTVFGYGGKQVRDSLHSRDLVRAFDLFFRRPRRAEVYNIGGGRVSNCSLLEAIELCQEISGRELDWSYREESRIGDHRWWISDNGRFTGHYPEWRVDYDVRTILEESFEANRKRWSASLSPRHPQDGIATG